MSILHFNCRRALNWLRFPLPLDSFSPWEARTAPSPTNAQRFTENYHLGDDLNGIGGENSDLGDPIYAVADGRVLLARDGRAGWGNVIIVLHAFLENGVRRTVQSYYGHCDIILISPGHEVHRGQQIATVGTANGRYFAHLHFEMREFITPFIGPGIGRKPTAGSTRALSSLRIAARPKMMLTEENRTIRSTAGLFRPNFDSHLVPVYRERASNTKQQRTDKDATSLPV